MRRIVVTENITLGWMVKDDDTWFDPTTGLEPDQEHAKATGFNPRLHPQMR